MVDGQVHESQVGREHAAQLRQQIIDAMHYPVLGADREVFDLAISTIGPDRYLDPCPSWCDGVHSCESNDGDRNHYGEQIAIPVRSIAAEWEAGDGGGSRYLLGIARMFLHRNVLRRDPTIQLCVNDTREGFDLTIDEAEQVGLTLLAMVGAAR